MKRFTEYLTEGKNLHMIHLEDQILERGIPGAEESIAFLKSLVDMLSNNTKGKVNVSVKWDGAPAVFVGTNPENGRFFVGSKSIFNKLNPKINYTQADIRKNHPGGLGKKLSIALKELKKLNIKGVIQGDMMYEKSDLKSQTIDGEKLITFQPNTITYAVPEDSDLGKQILKSKMGIVFHTEYKGRTLKDMSASFGLSVKKLKRVPSVWFDDANVKEVTGTATFSANETKEINKQIKVVEKLLDKSRKFLPQVLGNTKVIEVLKIALNANVRAGKDTITFDEFVDFLKARLQRESDKLKTLKAIERKEEVFGRLFDALNRDKRRYEQLFALHKEFVAAKIMIVRKLERIKSMGTFLKTDTGFKVVPAEGFVAIKKGSALKLVDRLEFSRNNFLIAKQWDK